MAASTIEHNGSSQSTKSDPSREGRLQNERVRALLREVRGPDILHIGCVGHRVAESEAEKAHSVHHQLCRSFPEVNVLGLDTDAANIERMKQIGFRVEIGDAQNLQFDSCFDS